MLPEFLPRVSLPPEAELLRLLGHTKATASGTDVIQDLINDH
jgi:hypothetical protein